MSSFADDIKSPFRTGNSVGQLIVINVAVFLALVIFQFILTISGFAPDESSSIFHSVVSWIALPVHFNELLYKPWTFFTYMFVHYSLWHIFGNMLMLFVFGKIFQEYASSKRVFAVYIYGALIGALLALITYQFIPTFKLHAPADFMVGASAGVMAMVLAAATLVPDYVLHLLLIGPVRLKHIALFVVVLDLIGVTYFDNAGGHLSHLGGALFGGDVTDSHQRAEWLFRVASWSVNNPVTICEVNIFVVVCAFVRQRAGEQAHDWFSGSGCDLGSWVPLELKQFV